MLPKPASAMIACGLSAISFLAIGDLSAKAESVARITSTGTIVTTNPHGDSATQMNSIWCQVYGCLVRWDHGAKKYVGLLAESWENAGPTTWRFTLRDDLTRHDGGPAPTVDDVIHAWNRINTDPESQQKHVVRDFADIVKIDDRTFELHTEVPDATIVSSLSDRFIITSKELFDQHGYDVDDAAPHGWGPYKLERYDIDERIILAKNEYWDHDPAAPDTVIYTQMREPSQRVTAALNGEVEIARMIPPEMLGRFEGREDIQLINTDAIELMFFAMNPAFEPWDDVRIRRAAAMAIDRDAIIERLLGGLATKLQGPVGPGQVCYSGPPDRPLDYDPEAARALLAEAGYTDGGPEVDVYSANGRYISDRQIGQVIASMLSDVGFDVTFHAPEWANLWSEIRTGKTPAFYMGRGSVLDPSDAVNQYLGTDQTPRIGYSNPALDELLAKERATFDDEARCAVWREINQTAIDEVPMLWMWTHQFTTAAPADMTVDPLPSGEIWLAGVRM